MKLCIGILVAMLTITTSQASMIHTGNEPYKRPTISVVQPKTVTRNVRVHVKVPRIQKPKLFRSNPHRAVHYALTVDQNDEIGIDDDDKITGYRRQDLQRIKTDATPKNPEGLSEDIRWRLFLARQAALLMHKEAHS